MRKLNFECSELEKLWCRRLLMKCVVFFIVFKVMLFEKLLVIIMLKLLW